MTNEISKPKPNSDELETKADKTCATFTNKVLRYNALACTHRRGVDYDRDEAIAESKDSLKALNAQGGLQEMLIAQMTSIHLLQQTTLALANGSALTDSRQYYLNSTVKLANCFTQQASLLAKLQGVGGQKIVVEHVEVHQGGQAVVGNINGGIPKEVKK